MTQEKFCAVMAPEPLIFSAGQCNGATQSSLWLPIDMFLEDIMDGSQVAATGAVEILTGMKIIPPKDQTSASRWSG